MPTDKQDLIYVATDKDLATQKWVYTAFDTMWLNNERTYEQFNGRKLQNYLDNGRAAINIMNRPREDGRSNVKSVTPLNKLLAINARVALKRPTISVLATNKNNLIDKARSDIIKDLNTWSYENIQEEVDSDLQYFFKGFDTQIDGTYISFEGFDNQTHTQKKIISYDPDTGDIETEDEEFKTSQCFNQHVKLTDFFIWNPYVNSIQQQEKVCWRTVYDKVNFDNEFGGYKNHKFVKPGVFFRNDQKDDFFQNQWQNRVRDNQIEVLRMFERPHGKEGDRMVVIANGVVLSDNPMIWQNGKPKKYPFARTINSPFAGGGFFWGMHLWHKLEGDVSAIETLYNLGIEQAKLSVNPPMLNGTENEIEDNNLLSGRVLDVDDITQIRELPFKSPDQSYFSFLEVIGKNIDLSTVDPSSQGSVNSDATARGQVIAEENARKLLGVLNLMMENLVLQEAKLRIPNIIQFQFLPGSEFRVNNTDINGESGMREVKVMGKNLEGIETEDEIGMIEQMAELHGVNLERLVVTSDYLNDIKYSLTVVKQSSFEQSKSLEMAMEDAWIGSVAKLFPEIFNGAKETFFKDYAQLRDKDPNKFLEAAQKAGGTDKMLDSIQKLQGGKPQNNSQNNKLNSELAGNKSLGQLSGVTS